MYPLKEWIWLRRLCPKKTENFTKRLKLKFLRIIHTIKTFFLQEDICCFTVLNLRELRYILPISQEIYWINVTVAVVLLLGVVLLCVAIVLRKKGAFRRDGGKFPVLAAEGPGMIVAAENHGKVYIEFPQIGEGLPDVWGIKENLAVVFHDDEGNRGEIGAVFHKKGEYRIKISGKNDEYGARNIRIVDYTKISGITDFMTLREIHDIIKPNIASERHWVLEDAFMVFEKAVYSHLRF